jgi:hypothetical protein
MAVHNLRGPKHVGTNFDGTERECEVHGTPRVSLLR